MIESAPILHVFAFSCPGRVDGGRACLQKRVGGPSTCFVKFRLGELGCGCGAGVMIDDSGWGVSFHYPHPIPSPGAANSLWHICRGVQVSSQVASILRSISHQVALGVSSSPLVTNRPRQIMPA